MARIVQTRGLLSRLAGWLLLVVAAAYAANLVYFWLLPLIPGLITAAVVLFGLAGLVTVLIRRLLR